MKIQCFSQIVIYSQNLKIKKSTILSLRQSYTALGTTVWDGSIALAKMFDNRDLFPLHYDINVF